MAHQPGRGPHPANHVHRSADAPAAQPVAPPTLPLPWITGRRHARASALAARKAVPQQHPMPPVPVQPDSAEQRAQKREWLLAERDIARVRRALRLPGSPRYRG